VDTLLLFILLATKQTQRRNKKEQKRSTGQKKKKKEQGVKGGVSVRYGAGLCDSRSKRMGFAVMNGG
jgi:hypothetical protein